MWTDSSLCSNFCKTNFGSLQTSIMGNFVEIKKDKNLNTPLEKQFKQVNASSKILTKARTSLDRSIFQSTNLPCVSF